MCACWDQEMWLWVPDGPQAMEGEEQKLEGAAGTDGSPVGVCLCLRGLPSAEKEGAAGHPTPSSALCLVRPGLAQQTGPSSFLRPLPVTRLLLFAGNSSDCLGGYVLTKLRDQCPGRVTGAVTRNPSPQGPCA